MSDESGGQRWHTNPETGQPAVCRASKRPCPLGGRHYASSAEAWASYHATHQREDLPQALSKASPRGESKKPAQWRAYDPSTPSHEPDGVTPQAPGAPVTALREAPQGWTLYGSAASSQQAGEWLLSQSESGTLEGLLRQPPEALRKLWEDPRVEALGEGEQRALFLASFPHSDDSTLRAFAATPYAPTRLLTEAYLLPSPWQEGRLASGVSSRVAAVALEREDCPQSALASMLSAEAYLTLEERPSGEGAERVAVTRRPEHLRKAVVEGALSHPGLSPAVLSEAVEKTVGLFQKASGIWGRRGRGSEEEKAVLEGCRQALSALGAAMTFPQLEAAREQAGSGALRRAYDSMLEAKTRGNESTGWAWVGVTSSDLLEGRGLRSLFA